MGAIRRDLELPERRRRRRMIDIDRQRQGSLMSDTRTYPAPPFDPELAVTLSALAEFLPPSLTPEMIPAMRAPLPFDVPVDETLAAAGVVLLARWCARTAAAPVIGVFS